MFVIATAGHVDHGKSTLVHRLTGTWPDRLAEEQRRGLTIDLGFAWTELDGRRLAFVDVPGHERFVATMLAGVGPVPAVLFVVAADEGWMPQSAEHLAALDALGVRHGLVMITKTDLADPSPAIEQVRQALSGTSLASAPVATTMAELRSGLVALTDELPPPDLDADVRLWVDRAFTVRGAGTVVTGTLAAGVLRVGDVLEHAGERVSVRGLQSLGEGRHEVPAVARVAVNLRGLDRARVGRGATLLTPSAWLPTVEVDVRLRAAGRLHRELVLHIGSAAVPVHVRELGRRAARLHLAKPLPLRVGDVGLLRDPGEHRIAAGVEILDVRPPALDRRGAARARAEELAVGPPRPPVFAQAADLRAMGVPASGRRIGDWVVDEQAWARARASALSEFEDWSARHPVAAGMPMETVRHDTGLPATELVPPLIAGTGLEIADGLVRRPGAQLPEQVERAVDIVARRLAKEPFRAPEADDLARWGLGTRELAAAVRTGRLVRIAEGVVLGPDALERAVEVLSGLPRPFTVSEARRALGTTRRVAVPLLERLDAMRATRRNPDGTRTLVSKPD
ncbi:selenocysteine-specific translation elongation factor [Amycolatopsis taiwanensis]|uniref:Translation elongation factor n=1 Tax=Amycolatopsis taiwanensis TaxID=342230 RepID=A0A9W6R3C8_9PSEU|nr:selenocysteine-specific translation elongation factor [Amycolatopsis taiwanensis]GLY68508.1 translation elongation factor [Amycolatopsis taiwanensis]